MLVGKFGAEFEQERQTLRVQRFTWAHHAAGCGTCAHGVQVTRGLDLALQTGAVECVLNVRRAEITEHLYDRVLADVRGIRHRRTPVAVRQTTGGVVQEPRISQHQVANCIDISAPDGVGHAAGGDEARPAWQAVAAGQR